ncbi:Peptidase S64, Ssy5 [Penicillium occitanis (nom. inval.)]|nr:hypothetical protein PENOC_072290 [Penicillium occitanis (nom. inval.)]PCH08795.1 Peptidase S64, Ssy5 [Penicillium occitanis (nom. inval.)]
MLGYESSMVTTRTVSGCISLPIHMSSTSFPEREFLPANPNHSITRSWQKNNIGDSIIALLEKHNLQFYAVDCLRRPRLLAYLNHILRDNPVFGNDSHTVVITLRAMPENHALLSEVMEVIHWELADGLTVEVRIGKIEVFYQTRLHLGCSIGLQHDPRSNGTAGGYVDLVDRNGEVVAQCMLTCEHVVRPYVEGDDEMKMLRPKADCVEPYLRDATVQTQHFPISCATPSIASNMEKAHNNRKKLIRLAGEILASKYSTDKETFSLHELQHLKYQRNKIQANTTKSLIRDDIFGTVYASSGYSFSRHRHRLDWALIEVDPTLIPKLRRNKVKDLSHIHHDWRQILHAVKPRKTAVVYKQGSVTDTTMGIVNPIQSHVVSYDADGKRCVTREWCIIPAADSNSFAKVGDSGSLVLERDTANVMGMAFGGHENGGPVYFTSITAIATHVEKVTGLRVQLPGGSIIGH